MLKLDAQFNSMRNDCLVQMFKMVRLLAESNILHRGITPKHLCYRRVLRDEQQSQGPSPLERPQENYYIMGDLQEDKSDRRTQRPVDDAAPEDSFWGKELIQPKKRTEGMMMSSFNSARRGMSLFQRKDTVEPRVQMRLIDFSKAEPRNSQIFLYRVRSAVREFLEVLAESGLKVDATFVDPDFDFYGSVKRIENDSFQRRNKDKVISKEILSMSSELSQKEDFDWYRSNINTFILGTSPLSVCLESQGAKMKGKNESLGQQESTLGSRLMNFFSETNIRPEKTSIFGNEHKQEIRGILRELKSGIAVKKKRHLSILGSLQIDCDFLEDIEALIYTTLDSLNIYPRMSSLKEFVEGQREQRSRPGTVQSLNELGPCAEEKAFLSNERVDVLIAVLALVERSDYATREMQISWFFKLELKDDCQSLTKMDKKDQKKGGPSVLGKFKRLKYLVEFVAQWKRSELLEVFGLVNQARRTFLNKLGLSLHDSSDFLESRIQSFQKVYKEFFFNFMVSFLFKSECHFFHKFCVLCVLKLRQ